MGDRTLMSGHPRASRRDFFVDFFSSFIGRGRPQVPLRALFQARSGTWVEPPTFRKPAGWLPNKKDFDLSEDRTYSGEGPVISSQRRHNLILWCFYSPFSFVHVMSCPWLCLYKIWC
jgi:hypothetical protein